MPKQTVQRVDPPSRPVDGHIPDGLRNPDPRRWYVLANPSDVYYGLDYMLGLGYEIETKRPGGPYFPGVNAAADGTAVTRMGNVLVSIPIEVYLERYNAGQARQDEIMNRIRRDGGPDGPLQGPTGRPAYWINHEEGRDAQ